MPVSVENYGQSAGCLDARRAAKRGEQQASHRGPPRFDEGVDKGPEDKREWLGILVSLGKNKGGGAGKIL